MLGIGRRKFLFPDAQPFRSGVAWFVGVGVLRHTAVYHGRKTLLPVAAPQKMVRQKPPRTRATPRTTGSNQTTNQPNPDQAMSQIGQTPR